MEDKNTKDRVEPWESWETKFVLISLVLAFLTLIGGLWLLPTSIINNLK